MVGLRITLLRMNVTTSAIYRQSRLCDLFCLYASSCKELATSVNSLTHNR